MDKGKILFKIALCNAGLTMSAWAKARGVSHSAVSQVLSGRVKSAYLVREIELFTKSELSKLKIKTKAAA